MMKQITGYSSNKAFTNQMLGQQLLILLSKEVGHEMQGYYKYHKITLFSTDSHLNHQIFVRKQELIETLISKVKKLFGGEVKIKDILFVARTMGE